ncbi:hypothetical protein Emed_007044 [Eimeria media]
MPNTGEATYESEGLRLRNHELIETTGEYNTELSDKEMALPKGVRDLTMNAGRIPSRMPAFGATAPAANLLSQQPASPASAAAAAAAYRPDLSQSEPVGSSRPGLSVRDLGAPIETRIYNLDELHRRSAYW